MEVLITLTSAGVDQGTLFDLYADTGVSTSIVPFETDVPVASLLAGYTTTVPDATTVIRVCGKEASCTNCLTLLPFYTTTTTTTFRAMSCLTYPGGEGYTEFEITLNSLGGLIVLDINAFGIPDKVEIFHVENKVATTGMTVANAGPFDDTTEPPNLPSIMDTSTIDQFVGTAKGSVPTREAEILADTGKTYIASMQLLWWEYTSADYLNNNTAYVRVTSPTTSTWDLTRICGENTTTTTTTIAPTTTTTTTTETPTTTTTTTLSGLAEVTISASSYTFPATACAATVTETKWTDNSTFEQITAANDRIFNDSSGTDIFVGDGNYYKIEFASDPGVFLVSRITFAGKFLDDTTYC